MEKEGSKQDTNPRIPSAVFVVCTPCNFKNLSNLNNIYNI